jgi:hypothetical protein
MFDFLVVSVSRRRIRLWTFALKIDLVVYVMDIADRNFDADIGLGVGVDFCCTWLWVLHAIL